MSPDIRARIIAKNETAPAFAEAVRDAQTAGAAIEASGRRAASGLVAQNAAMRAIGDSTKMAANQQRNLVFQLNDVAVSLAGGANPLMVFAQQGSQIATIYGPEEGGLGKALGETGKMATSMITKFWPIAAVVGAATLAVAGITNEIDKTAAVSVSMGDVVGGAFSLLGNSIFKELQPIAGWFGEMWDEITPGFKAGVNFLIGSFVTAYDNIKLQWGLLPAAVGDSTVRALNGVMASVESFLNQNRLKIAQFMLDVSPALGPFGGLMASEGAKLAVRPVAFEQLQNPWQGAEQNLTSKMAQSQIKNMSTDWVGEIGKRAEASALTRLAEDAGKAGKAAKAANDNFKDLATGGLREMESASKSFADAARSAFGNMGTGLIEAFRKGGDVAGNVLDMLVGKVGALGESLMNQGLNGLLDIGLNALFGAMGGGGGLGRLGSFSIGSLPMYANGTDYHPGGLAIVGERGPELVNLPRGSSVTPNGGGGPVMNFYITGSRQDATEIASIARQQAMDVVRAYQANPYRKAS